MGGLRRACQEDYLDYPQDFKMSFVVAHGTSRVEGIMGTKTTFNQNKYIKFLKTLLLKIKQSWDYDQQQIVVIADNWRFHRTEHVRSLFLNERVTWLFIPPYWPEINPRIKLINFIKGYVKSQISMYLSNVYSYMLAFNIFAVSKTWRNREER